MADRQYYVRTWSGVSTGAMTKVEARQLAKSLGGKVVLYRPAIGEEGRSGGFLSDAVRNVAGWATQLTRRHRARMPRAIGVPAGVVERGRARALAD